MKTILKAAIVACLPTTAFAGPVIVPSEGSVPETVARLKASVEGAGVRVFGVVDVESRPRDLRMPAPADFLWQYIYNTPLARRPVRQARNSATCAGDGRRSRKTARCRFGSA